MKNFIKNNRFAVTLAMVSAMSALSLVAFAEVPAPELSAIITTSFGTVVTDTVKMFAALLPLALTIFAFTYGAKLAIKFFKNMTTGN